MSDPHDELAGGDLEDVAQRLRAIGRADQRDTERLAIREAWRRRSYADVFREAMWRGDLVVLHLPGGPSLAGTLIDTGRDFVTIASEHAEHGAIDVQVVHGSSPRDPGVGAVALEVVERGATRGSRGSGDAFVTFSSRLTDYAYRTETDPTRRVAIAHRTGAAGWTIDRGELRAFAWDHVYVRKDAGEVFVPLGLVAYVHWIRRRPADPAQGG